MDMSKEEFLKMCEEAYDNNKIGSISDGYHTFDELYHHRAMLTASLFNLFPKICFKSKQHHDPEQPMYDGMFICGMITPQGCATYHYDLDPYWDVFKVPEIDKAPPFDGHTPEDAINRISEYAKGAANRLLSASKSGRLKGGRSGGSTQ